MAGNNKTSGVCLPRKPVPVRALLLRATRAVNTCDELGSLVLTDEPYDDYEVGVLVEQLQMQLTALMQTIHALDKRGG